MPSKRKDSSDILTPRIEFLRSRLILWKLNKKETKVVNGIIDVIHHIINEAYEREKDNDSS